MTGSERHSWATRPIFLVGQAHTGKTELSSAFRSQGVVVVRGARFWGASPGCRGDLRQHSRLLGCTRALASDPYLRQGAVGEARLRELAGLLDFECAPLLLSATVEAATRIHGLSDDPADIVIQARGLENSASELARELPGAMFVHAIRDPRGSSRSWQGRIGGRLGWRLAAWSASADLAIRNREVLAGRYLIVHTEDLIAHPEAIASQIAEATGVSLRLDEVTPSLGRKQTPLPPGSCRLVERLVGTQLERLGYQVDGPGRGLPSIPGILDAGVFRVRSRLTPSAGARA